MSWARTPILSLSALLLLACSPATGGLGDGSQADDVGTGEDTVSDTLSTESSDTVGTTTDTTDTTDTIGTTTDTTDTTTDTTDTTDTTTDTTDTTTDTTDTDTTDTTGDMGCGSYDIGVEIHIDHPDFTDGDCAESTLTGRLKTINGNEYIFNECDCADANCAGNEFHVTVVQPDPSWNPPLMMNGCYSLKYYTQVTANPICRYNRLDIIAMGITKAIYTTGALSEDDNKNGIDIGPVGSEICDDDCGSWDFHGISFKVNAKTVDFPFDSDGIHDQTADIYQVRAWPSWTLDPSGACDIESEVLSWTGIRQP